MADLHTIIDSFFTSQADILHWSATTTDPIENQDQFTQWLSAGKNGDMEFMKNNLSMRLNPKEFFPEAKSAILFLHRYPEKILNPTSSVEAHISAYARGLDYHHVMKACIKELEQKLLEADTTITLKAFVDSAPVNERELAVRAGLGWQGKNGALIHPKFGSQFFIGGFFINKSITTENRVYPDGCASCRKCIDACPTSAIEETRSIDARKCISYLTIEKKGDIDPELASKMGNNIFGCDICLEVCPWNKKHLATEDSPMDSKFIKSLDEWEALLQPGGGFKSQFKNTPLYRAGRQKMLRNVLIARSNSR